MAAEIHYTLHIRSRANCMTCGAAVERRAAAKARPTHDAEFARIGEDSEASHYTEMPYEPAAFIGEDSEAAAEPPPPTQPVCCS